MRTTWLVAALAIAAPCAPRAAPVPGAAPRLALAVFDGERGPSAAIEVPALRLLPLLAVGRDEGGGARARRGRTDVEPAIALVLGIIPGFGIGHLVAHSDRWVIWLVADVVIAVVFWGPWVWDHGLGGLNLLVLVERVFEGLDAYGEARGRSVFGAAGLPSPALAALPADGPRALAASGGGGWRF